MIKQWIAEYNPKIQMIYLGIPAKMPPRPTTPKTKFFSTKSWFLNQNFEIMSAPTSTIII